MKLRGQILLLVMLPLVALGGVIYLVGSRSITETMTKTIENGLNSTAVAVMDTIGAGREGDYRVDENGDMWKGSSFNISQNMEIADHVKEAAGVEVTVFFGDTRYMTSVVKDGGERAIGTKASEQVVNTVLERGEPFFDQHVDVAGEEFFAYYLPIYNEGSDKPVGMVFTGISQEEARDSINRIIHSLIGIILGMVLVCGILAWLIASRIVKGVKYGIRVLGEVAEGNLTVEIKGRLLRRKDEVGVMISSIAALKEQLVSLIGQIADKSRKVYGEAETLSGQAADTAEMVGHVEKAMEDIAAGAGSQAEETQEATQNVLLMGNMVEKTNQEVGSLSGNSSQIKEAGATASITLQELSESNAKVTEAVEVIYEQTNRTNESAARIRKATEFITSIAEETNLLSLNASIEAARAGDQGRGFVVVASQIQKLAEQSNESAKQIEAITESLIHDSEEAVATMNEIHGIMKEQNQKVEQTREAFSEVKNGIDQSAGSISAIADQTMRLDEARKKVVDGVQNLTAIAEENAASSQETSASVSKVTMIVEKISGSAEGLKEIAEDLNKNIEKFKMT